MLIVCLNDPRHKSFTGDIKAFQTLSISQEGRVIDIVYTGMKEDFPNPDEIRCADCGSETRVFEDWEEIYKVQEPNGKIRFVYDHDIDELVDREKGPECFLEDLRFCTEMALNTANGTYLITRMV